MAKGVWHAAPPAPRQAFAVEQQFSLLLVQQTADDLARFMSSSNYSVSTAADAGAAAAQLQAGQVPDLIIADWHGDAQELLQTLSGHKQWRSIPVVVTSTEAGPEAVVNAIRAGAADFLVKPLRSNELSTLWQHVWRRRHATAPSTAAAPAAALSAANAVSISSCANSDDSSTGCFSPSTPPAGPAASPLQQIQQWQQAQQSQQPAAAAAVSRASSPPPASPPAPTKSAPANCGAIAGGRDEATDMDVCSSAAAAAAPPRHSFDAGAGAGKPSAAKPPRAPTATATPLPPLATLFLRSAGSGSLPEAFAAAKLAPAGSMDLSVDLSIRPLDVTPRAPPPHSPTAAAAATSSTGAALLQGLSAGFGGFGTGTTAPHNRLLAKAAWQQQASNAVATRTGSLSHSSGSAFSSFSALASHSSARTASPPRAAPPVRPAPPVRAPPASRAQPAVRHTAAAATAGNVQQAAQDQKAACAAHRRAAIIKFRQKRESRNFDKKVRYVSRKRLAESRPRVRGQFVKAEVAAACRALAAAQAGEVGGTAAGVAVAAQ